MTDKPRISPMWTSPLPGSARKAGQPSTDLCTTLRAAVDQAVDACPVNRPRVWFRADDVAVPSHKFTAMLECFRRHDAPLALAVVPSWLTAARWREIQAQAGLGGRWCFHQHGRRHANHEPFGRKCEFGPARDLETKRRALLAGKNRLRKFLGPDLYPAFTPPWNRLDDETGQLLAPCGFMALSRNHKAYLRAPLQPEDNGMPVLPEIPVNCDLHTRRGSPQQAWTDFWAELHYWLSQGLLGFMLHHQRLNQPALEFLDMLLVALRHNPRIDLVGLDELSRQTEMLHDFAQRVRSPRPQSAHT